MPNWKCSSCGKDLTHFHMESIESDEESPEMHFDIIRAKKRVRFQHGETEEIEKETNVKMRRSICEKCFLTILNESPTLGNLFYIKEKNMFIY